MNCAILAAGDQPIGKRKRLEPDAMARHFIIKAEAVAGVARFAQAAFKLLEIPSGSVCRFFLVRVDFTAILIPVLRPQRIGEEGLQDVGKQQLLVLLLVIRAQLGPAQSFRLRAPLQRAAPSPRLRVRGSAESRPSPGRENDARRRFSGIAEKLS